jgi:hypothetical protein
LDAREFLKCSPHNFLNCGPQKLRATKILGHVTVSTRLVIRVQSGRAATAASKSPGWIKKAGCSVQFDQMLWPPRPFGFPFCSQTVCVFPYKSRYVSARPCAVELSIKIPLLSADQSNASPRFKFFTTISSAGLPSRWSTWTFASGGFMSAMRVPSGESAHS